MCHTILLMAQTLKTHHQIVKMDTQGRVVIPSGLRRSLGFPEGAEFIARVEGETLVLEPRDAVLRRLKARYKDISGSLATELLEERRAEAALEDE